MFFFLFLLASVSGLHLSTHPLERRIGYVYGLKDLTGNKGKLQKWFEKHPLLIFKGLDPISPTDFLNFVKEFDPDHDEDALAKPDENHHQMLQPFNQFHECKHVAPVGNCKLDEFHGIPNVTVYPDERIANNYLWHTDILGHEYKLPNVVTGLYIVEQPLIGGDTDFISGEAIYEGLTEEEKKAAKNILVEVNRPKFTINRIEMDYSGTNHKEDFFRFVYGTQRIPLVYPPDSEAESPRVLLMPTFFEKVVGWSVDDSRAWIREFVTKKVMPHRVSIQWRRGDLAVFNNRRFIHSSTPSQEYVSNGNSPNRLVLQTFIPTKKPLMGLRPLEKDVCATYNVGWNPHKEIAIISTYDHIKYTKEKIEATESCLGPDGTYILRRKPDGPPIHGV